MSDCVWNFTPDFCPIFVKIHKAKNHITVITKCKNWSMMLWLLILDTNPIVRAHHLILSETPSNASPSHLLAVSRLSHPRTDRLRNSRESTLLARFLATFFHLYHTTLSWSQATSRVPALVAVRLLDARGC